MFSVLCEVNSHTNTLCQKSILIFVIYDRNQVVDQNSHQVFIFTKGSVNLDVQIRESVNGSQS